MTRKVRSVFQAPRSAGVGAKSWSTSVGKASTAWRNKKKPRTGKTQKGWPPYGN